MKDYNIYLRKDGRWEGRIILSIDYQKILFLIRGKIENDISYYDIDNRTGKVNIRYSSSSKIYPFNQSNVRILENPAMINPLSNIFKTIKGTVLDNISVIYCFKDYLIPQNSKRIFHSKEGTNPAVTATK